MRRYKSRIRYFYLYRYSFNAKTPIHLMTEVTSILDLNCNSVAKNTD